MEPKNTTELFDLFRRLVKASTGLNDADAEHALALQGIHKPEAEVKEQTPSPQV